jgi:hypothetical protein
MTRERYTSVPLNLAATKKRWSKDPAFAAAYDALADEFATPPCHANAVCRESHTLAPKSRTPRQLPTR